MKKINLLCLLFLPVLSVSAQSFHKKNFLASIGYNLGIYGTNSEDLTNHEKKNDGAVSGIIPLRFEYGVSDHWGIGIGFRSNSFFSNGDTVDAGSKEGFISVNYHFLRKEHVNLFAGLDLGGSAFSYKNNYNGGKFEATGSYFQIGGGANIYFGNHLGIFFNLAFTGFKYKEGTVTDALGYEYPYSLSLDGVNFGTGVAVKF